MKGFSLIEVLLSVSILALIVTALVGGLIYGRESTALAGERSRATFLAEEGLEAVRNIRDSSFSNLTDNTFGLTTTGNQWNLSGSSDTTDKFSRTITISTVDTSRKQVISTISWEQNAQRTGSVVLTSRLTNWQGSTPATTTCDAYAIQQGYSTGTCRQNAVQCSNHSETYLSGGDANCFTQNPGDPSHDTCCGLP